MTAPIDLEALRTALNTVDDEIARLPLMAKMMLTATAEKVDASVAIRRLTEARETVSAALSELTTRRARDAEVAALVDEHVQWAESFGVACVCALQGDFHPIENLARCMPIHFPDGAPMLRSDPLAPFTGANP